MQVDVYPDPGAAPADLRRLAATHQDPHRDHNYPPAQTGYEDPWLEFNNCRALYTRFICRRYFEPSSL